MSDREPAAPPLAWLCDLDGTLYRAGPMKWAMAAELALLGGRHIRVIQRFRHEHECLREELRLEPERRYEPSPFEEQVVRTAAATGHDEAHVRRVVLEWMVARPGRWLRRGVRRPLLAELRAFRAAGGKTAVVSDYPATPKLRAMGLLEDFDVVISAGETPGLGRLKPSPDGYALAAEQLGVPRERCLVLGDREDADGDAARALGMAFRLVG